MKSLLDSLRRLKPYENLHGSARYATMKEIRKMGLLEGQGVYVGAVLNDNRVQYLRHNGPEHILAFAPTRSGKGVGLVVPTLLAWEHSTVVLDIKGENWALTAGWRRQHAINHCLRFEPASPSGSVKFNPLAEIRLGTEHEVADVQNIAMMIVDPDGKGLNDHWSKTGYSLIVGTALHCLYVEHEKGRIATILDIANCLADPASTIQLTLQTMLDTLHSNGEVHPVVASCAREMLNKSENELSGVVSTAMSFLNLYRDPIVARNTSTSEFKISDLMNADKPVSLYLIVSPTDIGRMRPLLRLILNQIVRGLTAKMEFKQGKPLKGYKHRLLLMLDEFPALGKLDIFQEALAYIAGYGLKAFLITQDLSQLYSAYGKDESIISNCHIRVAYAPNKQETQELLSKMLGTTTIYKKAVSRSAKPGLFQTPQYSESWQEVQRPLMTPQECGSLPAADKNANGEITMAGDMLIFAAGYNAIYGKQILFFKDKIFSARATLEPPQNTDRLLKFEELISLQPSERAEAAKNDDLPILAAGQVPDEPLSQKVAADSVVQLEAPGAPDVTIGDSFIPAETSDGEETSDPSAYSLADFMP
jgi:type IV secretion system protein VirD4